MRFWHRGALARRDVHSGPSGLEYGAYGESHAQLDVSLEHDIWGLMLTLEPSRIAHKDQSIRYCH